MQRLAQLAGGERRGVAVQAQVFHCAAGSQQQAAIRQSAAQLVSQEGRGLRWRSLRAQREAVAGASLSDCLATAPSATPLSHPRMLQLAGWRQQQQRDARSHSATARMSPDLRSAENRTNAPASGAVLKHFLVWSAILLLNNIIGA